MNKKTIIIFLSLLLLTGCVNINNNNYQEIAKSIINSPKYINNQVSKGYTYYLPKGVTIIDNTNYNQEFIINKTKIYLYVDIVSYYYQKNNQYSSDTSDNNYYYEELSGPTSKGYIKIIKNKNQFYVEIVYNYAKIELYAKEDNLKQTITQSLVIMKSIKYNKIVIKEIINNKNFAKLEQKYILDKPEESNNNFLDNAEKYNVQEENTYNLPE